MKTQNTIFSPVSFKSQPKMLIIVTQQTWRDPTEFERIWGNSSFYCYVSKVMLHWLLSSMILMCSYMTLHTQIYQIVRTYTFSSFFLWNTFRLGCPNFTYPNFKPTPGKGISSSLFFPDQAVFQGHPRFRYWGICTIQYFFWPWSWKHEY